MRHNAHHLSDGPEVVRQRLRRRRALAACVGLAVVAALATAASAAAPSRSSVPVVRCPTIFGVGGAPRHVRSSVSVARSAPSGLAAYTNTQIFLIGPRGLRCAGIVAADGGSSVIAWAKGQRKPGLHAHGVGLTLDIDPSCAGCRADDACPFFPAFARKLGFPCEHVVPAEERITRPRSTLAEFEDPPGVAGSGWPSGGRYAANGVVGVRGATAADALVYRATCTLPSGEHAICTASLDDVIARYS